MTDAVERIAAAVLYEGYVLWPYRRSATKNQKRWTFGGVYPRAHSEAGHDDDPWLMQTQCLLSGDEPVIDVKVRCLQLVDRKVARRQADGSLAFVDELRAGNERFLSWDEAAEREVSVADLRPGALDTPLRVPFRFPAGYDEAAITDPDGHALGALMRSWRAIEGTLEISAQSLSPGVTRLTVTIANITPWSGGGHDDALRQTLISTHTILGVRGGEFVSLLEPPEELQEAAAACTNIKTWPVLVGEPGERRTMLSSPIILYDYPRIAPESPGDLFDGTEIDELLILNVLALTDEEKAEMRASDPRTRAILERSESLASEDLARLHGAIRDFRMLGPEETLDWNPPVWETPGQETPWQEMAGPERVVVNGATIGKGSRVRLRPRAGGDIMDLALAGKSAVVAAVEQDFEGRIHLAVTVEDDPGRDLGEARFIGHRFFFSPDEVEPLPAGAAEAINDGRMR